MGKIISLGAAAITVSCLALLTQTSSAQDAATLTIEQFIGTVDIRTGDYKTITVTDADGVSVVRQGKRMNNSVSIDGGQVFKNVNCKKTSTGIKIAVDSRKWGKRKKKYKNLDQYPRLKITAPQNLHLVIDDALIFGKVGSIGSGDIKLLACGDVEIADISGHLDLGVSGSGDISLGRAGSGDIAIAGSGDFMALGVHDVTITVAGSGDVQIGDVMGSVDATIAGSGDTHINNISGDLAYQGGGSGDLDVGDVSGNVDITIGGSGNVGVGRIGGDLAYSGGGSGSFDAKYVGGTKLSLRTGGSGNTKIHGGDVTELYVKTGGSGSVHYGGKTHSAALYTRGSGNITIGKPSGRLAKQKRGSGKIHIR